MFTPKSNHFWDKPQNPYGLGHRWAWFADAQNKGTTADKKDGDGNGKEGDENPTEAQLNAERNREFAQKLNQLESQKKISEEAATTAKEYLQSRESHQQKLGRLLATQTISEDLFLSAHDALESDSQSKKGLAKKLAAGKIDQRHFENAILDIESGDTYRKSLGNRFALGQIDGEEFQNAHDWLDETDVDKKWAAQQLAHSHISGAQFREKIGMTARANVSEEYRAEQTVDPVAATQKNIHDRITELLLDANVFIEELPERERTRPVKMLRTDLQNLNTKDTENQRALTAYMRKLHEEEGLDTKQIETIRNFNIEKTTQKEDMERFQKELKAMGLKSASIKHVMQLKREEYNIEQDFYQSYERTYKIMEALAYNISYESQREDMIREAEKMTGIKLKSGTQLQYIYPDPLHGNIRTVKIKEVKVEDAPILNGIGEDANVIGRKPQSLTIILDNGEIHNIGRFAKWVNASDAHEVIQNKTDLEKGLNLEEVGLRFESGKEVEFDKGYERNGHDHIVPKRQKVKIRSIDDERVILDKPVVTLNPSDDPHAHLSSPRIVREMNLGEFSKWARRQNAIPAIIGLEALRETLKAQKKVMDEKHERDPKLFPTITLEPGEVLQYGSDNRNQIKIKKADDDGVTFENGETMTLPQFFNWVRDNNIERSKPEDIAERQAEAAKNLGEEMIEEIREKEKKKAEESQDLKDKKGENGQSIFEKISPYIPQMSKTYGIRTFIAQYTWISPMDVINLAKELLEFIKRKHARRSKSRYGKIGSMLPSFLGTEFERVQQAAENEEVNQYKESMAQWGTWQILDKLHTTHSKDEAKACFITLTEKGELRWDDMKIWKTLNRLTSGYTTSGARLNIPITKEAKPHPDDPSKLVSGEDRAKEAINALWGEGQSNEWFSTNVSKYNSNKGAYEAKGKQLEADPKGTGGLNGELRRLLSDWKAGEYVNPQEYEELIDFSIKYGKMSMEQKLFYLIEGVTAKCPSGAAAGMTLLDINRIGEVEGVYLNQFPVLDFFTNKNKKPYHPKYLAGEIKLEDTKHGYTIEDYEAIINYHFKEDSLKNEPGNKFSGFLWETMLMDPQFKVRLSKGLRNAQNMDHDDAHVFIPTSTMQDIDSITTLMNGTGKFTNEGLMNGYAGFNQYLVSLSNRYEELNEEKKAGKPIEDGAFNETVTSMISAFQTFFIFDSYLSGRNDRANNQRTRLDPAHYKQPCVVDGMQVGKHRDQVMSALKEVFEVYNIANVDRLLNYRPSFANKNDQAQFAGEIDNFLKNILPDAIQKDGGKEMLKIIRKRKLNAIDSKVREDQNSLAGIGYCNRLLLDKKFQEKLLNKGEAPGVKKAA